MTPLYILRGIPLFKNLENDDLKLVASKLHKESYAKGDCVFNEGDVGDTMYLVESGQVEVKHDDTDETIAYMGPGSFVGEISLLLAQPRTASLRVAQSGSDLALSRNILTQPFVLTRGILSNDGVVSEHQRKIEQRLDSAAAKKGCVRAEPFLQGEE